MAGLESVLQGLGELLDLGKVPEEGFLPQQIGEALALLLQLGRGVGLALEEGPGTMQGLARLPKDGQIHVVQRGLQFAGATEGVLQAMVVGLEGEDGVFLVATADVLDMLQGLLQRGITG